MTAATEDVIDTNGVCLTAGCTQPAVVEVQVCSLAWWPECQNHADDLAAFLPRYARAVRPARPTPTETP